MEDNLFFFKTKMTTSKKMEDYLKKKWKKTYKKNENGRRPQNKWKMKQSTKINLIGCDTIVN